MNFTWDNIDDLIQQFREKTPSESMSLLWDLRSKFGRIVKYDLDAPHISGTTEFFEFTHKPIVGLIIDNHYHHDTTIIIQDNDWIRFNFSLAIWMSMSGDSEPKLVDHPSWRFIHNSNDHSVTEEIPAGAILKFVTICSKADFLKELTSDHSNILPDFFTSNLDGSNPRHVHKAYEFTSDIEANINRILSLEVENETRLFQLEAIILDLLIQATNQLKDPTIDEASVNLSQKDRRAINDIAKSITASLQNPPTIAEITQEYGLNRNKLYYGFKWIHGYSISDFILKERMYKAMSLLKSTDDSIQEIAYCVGYDHQGNFSSAFKKHFGQSPRDARK